MKLSYYINLILKLENSNLLTEEQSFVLDGFDRSILILDDISDHSTTRDGQPCFYITYGVEAAKQEAQKLYREAFSELELICKKRNFGLIKRYRAKLLLRKLHRDIEKGQTLDIELEKAEIVSPGLLKKYDIMVTLFTGNHIRSGFALGFLLSGKKSTYKEKVLLVGQKIGILRQIDDDIRDYNLGHHEPLGDLIQHKKRLPELLFLLDSSAVEKERLGNILKDPKNNYQEIRNIVFNKQVNNALSRKTSSIVSKVDSALFDLPENYQTALKELMRKFSR